MWFQRILSNHKFLVFWFWAERKPTKSSRNIIFARIKFSVWNVLFIRLYHQIMFMNICSRIIFKFHNERWTEKLNFIPEPMSVETSVRHPPVSVFVFYNLTFILKKTIYLYKNVDLINYNLFTSCLNRCQILTLLHFCFFFVIF